MKCPDASYSYSMYDMMEARALAAEEQLTAMRSKMEAADGIAEALKETLHLLSVVPMSFPYNDRSQEVRGRARPALARWDEARKASTPSQALSNLDEVSRALMGEESGNA